MKSIAFKLWASMMALVAIVLLLLWLFQIVFLNSFYTGIRINEIIKTGLSITEGIDDLQSFKDHLDEMAYNNNLTAELLDLNDNTIYTTGTSGTSGMMGMMRNAVRNEAFEKALTGEIIQLQTTHPRFNSKYMIIGLPVGSPGEIQGALVLTLPLVPVEDTVNILKKQLVYITLILLAATLILSFLLSKSFTKPIRDINKVSLAMAGGNLSARINSRRKDEIGRLAQTINYLGIELAKTDQLRKDIVANVSHEIRTPLSLIKGYAETIRDVSGNNEEKRERQLGIIIEESDRLSKIVEDILNLSQMQAGFTNLKIGHINFNELLERLIKRFEILSESTGISITLDSPADVIMEGDEARIEQVMYNLVNNAFNHSPEGSAIQLRISENGYKYKVEVSDKGEGIPSDELQNIWERFYKVDKSGKRKSAGGSGLGLSIVKSILEAHNASFGVDSKPGAGTKFWFELLKV